MRYICGIWNQWQPLGSHVWIPTSSSAHCLNWILPPSFMICHKFMTSNCQLIAISLLFQGGQTKYMPIPYHHHFITIFVHHFQHHHHCHHHSHHHHHKSEKWCEIRRPILGICALKLSHQKCTHTALNTHTRSSGQPFMLCCPRSNWGGALLKGTSVVVLMVERVLYIHSPDLQFLPARDLNSQALDYVSVSLTIRPQLPPNHYHHHHQHHHHHLCTFSTWALPSSTLELFTPHCQLHHYSHRWAPLWSH